MYIPCLLFCVFFDRYLYQALCIYKPNIYVYIICLLMDKSMLLLFVYQLKSFLTGHRYLLQRNSLP